ncbi:MAG: radical SAM protein [Nanoarchaeota archaeon]|nr:radical SAM protein [Nanoarchaeota archaeon]
MVNEDNSKIGTYIFELTNRCNESCAFCYSISFDSNTRKARTAEQLTGDDWLSGLKNIVQEGARAVDFSGGEPTLHTDFSKIIEKAKNLYLYTIVSTNGTIMRRRDIRESLEKYADCIALSIQGVGDLHDQIKGRRASYEGIIEAYQHYSSKGKKMKVNTVVCRDNLHDLYEIGDSLHIEESQTQWKLSQAVSRESGRLNKELVHISDDEFENVMKKVVSKFPKAYSEGRVTFKEDDSQVNKFHFAPYVIVSSDGEIHIPIGEQHTRLGVNVLDRNYYEGLSRFFRSLGNFPEKVNENHDKFYQRPYESQSDKCKFEVPLSVRLIAKGII